MTNCKDQMKNLSDPNVQTVGHILLAIYEISPQAQEIIEHDLTIEEMNIQACFKKIEAYARVNKSGNCFSSAVFGIDVNNPIIKIILDFYKTPSEMLTGETISAKETKAEEKSKDEVSFWDLLG